MLHQSKYLSLSQSVHSSTVSQQCTELLRSGWQRLQRRDFKSAEEEFEYAVSMCDDVGSMELLRVHKEIAKMWMKVYSVWRALPHLKEMKRNAEIAGKPGEKMKAYRDLGTCYQLMRRYDTSLLYFKKQLESAWYYDNLEMELSAYDNIGKQYYYLGELNKAAYYNNRAWGGIVEPKNSPARQLARNAYEARKKPRMHMSMDSAILRPHSSNSSDIHSSELPSPSTNSTSLTQSVLPHNSKLPPLKRKDKPLPKTESNGSFILLSHLSLNRSLKNYQCLKDARKVRRRVKPLVL